MLACLLVGALAAPAQAGTAGGAFDYTKLEGLFQARFGKIIKERRHVPVSDGTQIYVEVTRPKADRRYPVILEASPYHGTLADRKGTRILPGPTNGGKPAGLTGYFAPRGYAVVMMDLRGTGRSRGCLDHLGRNDRRDLKQIVEWAASREWSNGRVGMTGHSYVGATPTAAAAMDPEGLKTIVPSAGLATMYDHQFQAGVPYYLQWIGTMEAYEELAITRKLPPFEDPFGLLEIAGVHTGDDFPNNLEDTGCGLPQSSLVAGEDQLSGRYAPWHAVRDWRTGATEAEIPIFLVHGVNDDAARVDSMQWFTDRGNARFSREQDKLWLGQWNHGVGCCPNRRGIQWTLALHAWFDRWLARRDVDTGPPAEIFLADGTFEEVSIGERTEVLTMPRWPGSPRMLTFRPTAAGGLSRSVPKAGQTRFTGDPLGHVDNFAGGGATFETKPLRDDMVLAGVPDLRLAASVTMPRVHLIGTLFETYRTKGELVSRRLSQCAINPELRNGIRTRKPVVPGERYKMRPPCFAVAQHVRAGHRLVLRITTSDPDKVPLFAVDPNITVFTGRKGTKLELPLISRPHLSPDRVPLKLKRGGGKSRGPAQPGFRGASMPLAPGAGARVEGVSSEFFQFQVRRGFDNSRMQIRATPSQPADVDLFLQRKRGGGWSDDIAEGTSADLEGETLATDRLTPGRYRLETNLYAGLPATVVDLVITFFNRKGQPGGTQ